MKIGSFLVYYQLSIFLGNEKEYLTMLKYLKKKTI